MGFWTCCKALKEERVACKGEAGEGITKNFQNTRGVKIGDIKTYEGGKETSDRLWDKSSPMVEGWVRGAQLSTSGMTLAEPAQCSILKPNSAIERHQRASLDSWGKYW